MPESQTSPIQFDRPALEAFCLRWKVQELALFGSALTPNFNAASDIDLLVTFAPDAPWSLLDWGQMVSELEQVFHRPVDLVESGAIRNPYRQQSILSACEVLYAA